MLLPRRRFEASIPAMAMGDIAFLLLIFFVILARAQDDTHVQWQPAEADPISQAGPALASVAVDVDNKTFLNGRPIGTAQLAEAVAQLLGDAPQGSRQVLLKVHKDAPAFAFEPVVEAISEAGGDLIHVLEPAPPSP